MCYRLRLEDLMGAKDGKSKAKRLFDATWVMTAEEVADTIIDLRIDEKLFNNTSVHGLIKSIVESFEDNPEIHGRSHLAWHMLKAISATNVNDAEVIKSISDLVSVRKSPGLNASSEKMKVGRRRECAARSRDSVTRMGERLGRLLPARIRATYFVDFLNDLEPDLYEALLECGGAFSTKRIMLIAYVRMIKFCGECIARTSFARLRAEACWLATILGVRRQAEPASVILPDEIDSGTDDYAF